MAHYRIQWFGHSMWKVESNGVSIITDPFSDIGYPMPKGETADIVLSSHGHHDHNNFDLIHGDFRKINQQGRYSEKGINIEMIPIWHDDELGSKRGRNLLMKFEMFGRTFLHCGDQGHLLDKDTIQKVGAIDVMFVPVGRTFTLDPQQAWKQVQALNPTIVFPMHYKTPNLRFEIQGVESFLEMSGNHRTVDSNVLVLEEHDFQQKQTITMNYME